MDSTYQASRDWATTWAVRELEARIERLETANADLERRHELLVRRTKSEMWSEIWMERVKAAAVVSGVLAILVWARSLWGIGG